MGNICCDFNKRIDAKNFQLITEIARGHSSKLFLAIEKLTKQQVAIKQYNKKEIITKDLVQNVFKERNLAIQLSGPFVSNAFGSFQDEDNLYLVFEFIHGPELTHIMHQTDNFGEDFWRFYIAEILVALDWIHTFGIIHGDIKPENILISAQDGHIRIIDFDSATDIIKETSTRINPPIVCGTFAYMAPELLKIQNPTFASDFYSVGVILYEMFHGLPPFYSPDQTKMLDQILNDKPIIDELISKPCGDLIAKLLEKNPNERIGYNGFQEIQKHEFFKGIDWEQIAKKSLTPPLIPKPLFQNIEKNNWIPPLEVSSILTQEEQKIFKNYSFQSNVVKELLNSKSNDEK
ncbi:non-specific serine/threonine protein kinase [Anaeramoeba ignava]|uniref:non-specific serine/threonine protein kinase n=1 Tax=Anaeramoeba ignava TaxID=1746090 RepID=A0A9Q0LA22_ANAIG|nr:non-specific serine/threonine protein kinase [Anaeramoeba ignava]